MTRRVVPLTETRRERDARIGRLADDGTATDVVPGDGSEAYIAAIMTDTPPTSGKGGTSRKATLAKKRGTWVCPSCNLEDCEHRRKRGRPKASNPRTARLRVYLPSELERFLQRSSEESGLRLTDILEAVLDSDAMQCWRLHIGDTRSQHHLSYVDEEGNDIEVTAYDEAIRDRERRRSFSFSQDDDWHLMFLKQLRPNVGPRYEERVTPNLLARVQRVGKGAKQPQYGTVRYSNSVFCAYCVGYYRDSLALIRGEGSPAYGETASSSKEEARTLKRVATTCPKCSRHPTQG